ncbi:hypothetical protein SO694_00152025 [Aureococcus anophagefferens]|uniref:Uncharacterized protein n=1 Tax=Aureococcus anophagefferens TaxID=44056 RepID=A0ABR1FZS3_AURAN
MKPRKPRNSKVHATDDEEAPPPKGTPGTATPTTPKTPGGGAAATVPGAATTTRRKKDDEPKGPGVLNAKTYEQRESTVGKMVEDIDVAKHDQHSGALAAFLDLLGIRKDAPVVPQNASAGAVARTYVALKAAPGGARAGDAAYSFATHGKRGREKSEAALAREYKETRERLKAQTALVIARQKDRAEEAVRKAREGEIHYDPSRRTTWHATRTREFEVATSSGERESLQLKVWTTADIRRDSRRPSGFRLPFGRRGSAKVVKNSKAPTRFAEFNLSAAQRRAILGLSDGEDAGPIFEATWKFLDEAEREFAATFYLQSWVRRVLFKRDPDKWREAGDRLKERGAVSLLSALVEMSKARVSFDTSIDPPKKMFALPAHEEAEISELFSAINEQAVIENQFMNRHAKEESEDEEELPPREADLRAFGDLLGKRCGADGLYKDPKTGFSYGKDYAIGPAAEPTRMRDPTDEEISAELFMKKEKMKQDLMLALHTVDTLPTAWKRPLKMMKNAGWAESDALWTEVGLELFNASVLQIAQKESTGQIYEVWIT